MGDGITHDNKDVLFKVLSQNYKNKSFEALGLSLPKIKEVLPTQLPSVSATEIRADNIFLLEDGRILIVDYESQVKVENFIKYLGYIHAVLKLFFNQNDKVYNIAVLVIYTGDIKSASAQFTIDCLQITINQVFLSNFNTDELYDSLSNKVTAGEPLTDEDTIKFIFLPLTESRPTKKQALIEKTIDLAKKVQDEQIQIFIIAGILVATDKFINRDYSNSIKEWIGLTKIGQLYEEEKIEAVIRARKEDQIILARKMLSKGYSYSEIMDLSGLSKNEVLEIQSEMKADTSND